MKQQARSDPSPKDKAIVRQQLNTGRLMAIPALLLLLTILIPSCAGPAATTAATTGTAASATAGTTTATTAATDGTDKVFTLDELSQYDGLEGRKAYIAVEGIVYDVTLVTQWGAKLHAGKFQAGKDYTEEIKKAPHGLDKLLIAVKVGVLKTD